MRRHLQEETDNHNTALQGLSRQHQRRLFDQGRSMQRDSRKGWCTGGGNSTENQYKRLKKRKRSLLINVGSSFSPNETAINRRARCALYSPCDCQCSVLQVFKAIATRIRGKSKQTLKTLKIEQGTSRLESRALAN